MAPYLPRMATGTRSAAAAVLLAATMLVRAAGILSWDDAYKQAEETLAKMTEPLLYVSGTSRLHSLINGQLFQRQGSTSSGSPIYALAGYYMYFDPSCDGAAGTGGRWTLTNEAPDTTRAKDLDADGACANVTHFTSQDAGGPPLGTHRWRMTCDPDHKDVLCDVDLTLSMVQGGEKYTLLKGLGWDFPPKAGWFDLHKWWYVGNTAPIPRLGVPSLNMQDAAAGFRNYWSEVTGTSTVWPSGLAMAATWDPAAVRAYAEGIGREFAGKGANGILGPSVEVHRVARNGRNFEYLSGEDPYLGAKLTKAYVEGVQSQGVFAVVKHWVFNQQETRRDSVSSVVDDKTAWELYYPPFQAAVEAGVSGAMCSYNRVDGEYSCSNKKQLDVLHNRMGFRGFVQSDWWATHNLSLAEGLDQEMPGIGSGAGWGHAEFFGAPDLARANQDHVDTAAKRVLAVMHRMDLFNTTKCSPPNCKDFFTKVVKTPATEDLARRLAAKSVVLLQNRGGLLPLSARTVRTIAIIGAAANASCFDVNGVGQGQVGNWATGDYYSGGGSGHLAGDIVTPWAGLQRRAAELGIKVVASLSSNVAEAVAAAKLADVAIVVAATTSGESNDRANLLLDDAADALVDAVRLVARTAVLMQVPGPIVMPWRDSVESILAMFLGGQGTGSAWADIVFGDVVPTGRLPVMMPDTENDAIAPTAEGTIVYSEGMATSYRNKAFKAAFPFGHGLTYSTFDYLPASMASCSDAGACSNSTPCEVCIRMEVRNAGTVAAPTVAQLYLELPPVAGHPAPLLKGFRQTGVIPAGRKEEVVFYLEQRDVSYYDVDAGGWAKASGSTKVHLGESSADIRQMLAFCLGSCDVPEPAARSKSSSSRDATWITIVCILSAGLLATCVLLGVICVLAKRKVGKGARGAEPADDTTHDAQFGA